MRTGLSSVETLRRADERKFRMTMLISLIVFVILLCVVFCLTYGYSERDVELVAPGTVIKNIGTYFRVTWIKFFSPDEYEAQFSAVQGLPYYTVNVHMFGETLTVAISGILLASSGALFQNVMRNPVAEPTMLGVQSGVNLGNALVVMKFGTAAMSITTMRYAYCYGAALILVALVFACGKISGGKRISVVDMILGGVIINRVFNGIVNAIRFTFEDDAADVYQTLTHTPYLMNISLEELGLFCLVAIICLMPVYLMRFSFNAVSFDDSDAQSMGINPRLMQIIGLISGGVLFTTAMVFCGNIGLISLLIPHLSRFLFGADFKKVVLSSAVFGGVILLVSRIISMFVYISHYSYSYQMPMSLAVFIVMIPPFIWLVSKQKRGWE